MSKVMTKAERVERAIDRAEAAAMDLVREAENFSLVNASMWDKRCYRVSLLEKARRYAAAIHAVSRVRSPSRRENDGR